MPASWMVCPTTMRLAPGRWLSASSKAAQLHLRASSANLTRSHDPGSMRLPNHLDSSLVCFFHAEHLTDSTPPYYCKAHAITSMLLLLHINSFANAPPQSADRAYLWSNLGSRQSAQVSGLSKAFEESHQQPPISIHEITNFHPRINASSCETNAGATPGGEPSMATKPEPVILAMTNETHCISSCQEGGHFVACPALHPSPCLSVYFFQAILRMLWKDATMGKDGAAYLQGAGVRSQESPCYRTYTRPVFLAFAMAELDSSHALPSRLHNVCSAKLASPSVMQCI